MTVNKRTLSNGVTVLVDTVPTSRVFDIQIAVRAGSLHELIPGTAHFVEHMMFKGTDIYTEEQIRNNAKEIGADINASTDFTTTRYTGSCLVDYWKQLTQSICHRLSSSTFDPDKVESERKVILSEIEMYLSDPIWVWHNSIVIGSFGDDTPVFPIIGTRDSVMSITPEDLRAYVRKNYTTENIVVSIAGNVDLDEVCKLITTELDDMMPYGESDAVIRVDVCHPRNVHLEDDRTDVMLMLYVPHKSYIHPDYPAQRMLRLILGHDGELFNILRTQRGLCYSASAYPIWVDKRGICCITAGVQPENVCATIDAVFDTLVHVYKTVDSAMIDHVLLSERKSDAFSEDSVRSRNSSTTDHYMNWGRVVSNDEAYNRLATVTPDDVRRAIREMYTQCPALGICGKDLSIPENYVADKHSEILLPVITSTDQ